MYEEQFEELDCILNSSDYGFYLVVADKSLHQGIADKLLVKAIKVYDYSNHTGLYSFNELEQFITSNNHVSNFMLLNMQSCLHTYESRYRLNFSRDMLNRLKKNIIFLVDSETDDMLCKDAMDFYSFLKLRIIFN